jgi:hypothetical protein
VTLSRRILRLLLKAHNEGVIELSGSDEVMMRDWLFFPILTLGVRWKLGALWKTYGPAVVESGVQETTDELESALCA